MTGIYRSAAGRADATAIPTLQGSPLHELGIALYQRHRSDPAGVCARCQCRSPCPPRCRAASVIEAAGDVPGRYDARMPTESTRAGHPADVQILSASAVGYPVGNADRIRVPGNWQR